MMILRTNIRCTSGICVAVATSWLLAGCGMAANDRDAVERTATGANAMSGAIEIPADSPMLSRITVANVELRELAMNRFVAPARIAPDPALSTRVRLPAPGIVTQVHVRPGEVVQQGQPLLTIDSPEADGAVAAHAQAVAAERQAGRDLERVRELYEADAIARRELIEAETELTVAQAELAQTTRLLRTMGLTAGELDQSLTVSASRAGRVLDIEVAAGEFVAEPEESVLTIADLSRVWAIASIPENRLRFLSPDDSAELTLYAWPDETFDARILRISDVVDEDTRTLRVYLEVDNPDGRLRPSMFGSVQFSGDQRAVAAVPMGTVIWQGGRALTLVETGSGLFEPREVTVAARAGDWLPVESGIAAGERVVTDGALLLLGQPRAR